MMSEITVTESDGGRVIEVDPGDTIQVRLEEMGGTAYAWNVSDVDASVLSHDASADDYSAAAEAVGGGSFHTMVFRAHRAGQTRLDLQRADRYSQDVDKQLSIEVKVRG